jgi:hypothetical protein
MTPHEHLVSEIADAATKRVVKRTIRALQALKDGMLLGDDTGLLNTWDEICAQIQTDRSIEWWAYETTARDLIATECERLGKPELKAIWLETGPGVEWTEEEGANAAPCYCLDDVEEHAYAALLTEAANYSNKRIQDFIYR